MPQTARLRTGLLLPCPFINQINGLAWEADGHYATCSIVCSPRFHIAGLRLYDSFRYHTPINAYVTQADYSLPSFPPATGMLSVFSIPLFYPIRLTFCFESLCNIDWRAQIMILFCIFSDFVSIEIKPPSQHWRYFTAEKATSHTWRMLKHNSIELGSWHNRI
jgi:hypothetical protein